MAMAAPAAPALLPLQGWTSQPLQGCLGSRVRAAQRLSELLCVLRRRRQLPPGGPQPSRRRLPALMWLKCRCLGCAPLISALLLSAPAASRDEEGVGVGG